MKITIQTILRIDICKIIGERYQPQRYGRRESHTKTLPFCNKFQIIPIYEMCTDYSGIKSEGNAFSRLEQNIANLLSGSDVVHTTAKQVISRRKYT